MNAEINETLRDIERNAEQLNQNGKPLHVRTIGAEILKSVKDIRAALNTPTPPRVVRSDTLDFIRCRGCGFIVPMRKDDGKWRLTDHATDGRPFKAEKALGGNHSRCVRSGDVATGLPEKELTHPMDWAPETVSEAAAYQLPEAEADAMRTGDPADARGDEYDSFSA